VKCVVLSAPGQKDRIINEQFRRRLCPASARERPIDLFIIQLSPEKLFELVFALEILQNAEDCLSRL
jgi:hypothetical protein